MRLRKLVIGVLTSLPAVVVAQTHPLVEPGQWEITSLTTYEGSSVKRSVTSKICYSDEMVLSPSRIVPPHRGLEMKCDVANVKAEKADISWKVVCQGKGGALAGGGKMSLNKDSYTARTDLVLKSGGKTSKVEQQIAGRRLGECK